MLDLEQSLIGGILKNPESLVDVLDLVKTEDFVKSSHRALWASFVDQNSNGNTVDLFVCAEAINDLGYVTELATNSLGSNLETYALAVSREAIKRSAARWLSDARQKVLSANSTDEVASILSSSQGITEGTASTHKKTEQMIKETIQRLDLKHRGECVQGLMTGFENIDERLQGIQPSDFIIIAGRPSMGKTTFAMNIAERVSLRGGNVLVFSMEMSQEQLMDRLLSSCSGVPLSGIRSGLRGQISDDTWSAISAGTAKLMSMKSNLTIIDKPAMHIDHLSAIASKFNRARKLDMIVIDYLQLMRSDSQSRFEEISTISRKLKALAVTLKAPVFALSQLSRKLEDRNNKRPISSDIRESGQIEQDADIIQFLYREEVYNNETENKGLAEVITSKFRNGETGTDYLDAELHKSRFLDTRRFPVQEVKSAYKY